MTILTRETVLVGLLQLNPHHVLFHIIISFKDTSTVPNMFNFAVIFFFPFKKASLLPLSAVWDHCNGCHQSNSPVMYDIFGSKVSDTFKLHKQHRCIWSSLLECAPYAPINVKPEGGGGVGQPTGI